MTTSTSRTRLVRIASISLAAGIAATAAADDHAASSATPMGGGTVEITCTSDAGERRHCPAGTSAGVLLVRETGDAACLLGRSWGYDAEGVWVAEGCGGEFLVAAGPAAGQSGGTAPVVESPSAAAPQSAAPAASEPAPSLDDLEAARQPTELRDTWGFLDAGNGFLVGRSKAGELSVSAYALVRFMDQMPGEQTFTDHLGNERAVDGRLDIYSHRVLVWLKGWVGNPKLQYMITFWTVNTTDQDAIFGNIGYRFNKRFNLWVGVFGNPGSRSMQGSHPYWLGNDRVMADEFFRPFFSQGIVANGELTPGLWYSASAGNTSSTLGVTASQIDRELTYGGSLWWMPTTKEFGPRGAYGDWEWHENVATRFGVSATYSPEERYTAIGTNPGNTALKLADSVNLFETGALAPGVTVTFADYRILALDAGFKYKGIFLQTELYQRWLDGFVADGALPVTEIVDRGFYVQAAFYPVPRKLELYAATSQIFGDEDAGFDNSSEYLVGANWYPFDTRNHRLNLQVIDVNHSPVSSTFGYYTAGQDGTTVSAAFSVFF